MMGKRHLIFYGAGRQAQYLFSGGMTGYQQFPVPSLEDGVCFADADKRKYQKHFLGLPVMSIEDALERYPDADIYVALGFPAKYMVFGFLTEELCISPERILNYEQVEKYASCEYLQGYLLIQREELGFCFDSFGRNKPPIVKKQSDTETSIDRFIKEKTSLIKQVREGQDGHPCAGCRDIRVRYWPNEYRIRHLNFYDYRGCNIQCSYCDVKKTIAEAKRPSEVFNYVKFIDYLNESGLIEEDFRCDIQPGEITVHPYKNEILSAVKLYPNVFFTNALIYDQGIAEILENGLSYVYVSVDAGTRETFSSIKGIDAFERVCRNIREYSKHGTVELKYIILPGINDNYQDMYGFIQLCESIQVQNVMISRNYHGWQTISNEQLQFTIEMYEALMGKSIPVSIPAWQYSDEENKRITDTLKEKGIERY